jgi:hypothetical protein
MCTGTIPHGSRGPPETVVSNCEKLEKSGSSKVKLVRDKIFVNGKLYNPNPTRMECDTASSEADQRANQQKRY